MYYYMPSNLDVESLIKNNPPTEFKRNFKKHHLLYILDKISTIPAYNKNIDIRNGYVPICSKYLQNVTPDYRNYLQYLQKLEVIEINRRIICRGSVQEDIDLHCNIEPPLLGLTYQDKQER
jgi:hypothetical protein